MVSSQLCRRAVEKVVSRHFALGNRRHRRPADEIKVLRTNNIWSTDLIEYTPPADLIRENPCQSVVKTFVFLRAFVVKKTA